MADGHLYLFERCKSYKDRKISSNDFNGVASVLKLPEHFVARVSVDNQGRVLYDDFVAVYNSYFDDSDSYRPGVRSSNRYLYSKQGQVPLRSEAVDNSGKKERKETTADQLYVRAHRNDDRMKKSSSRGYHEDQYSSLRLSAKKKSHPPRSVIESHKSEGSDCSDDESPMPYATSTSPMTSLQRGSHCKHCLVQDRRVEELEEDLQAVRKERKRLENSMHSIRNDFQSYYKKASELQAENDRLRARFSNKYVDNDYGGESSVSDLQHEKTRRQLEDKLSYSEGIIMQLQKENHKLQEDVIRLKSERSRLQNKNRDIEKELWHVQNEVQDVSIRLLQEQKSRTSASSEKSTGRAPDNLCFNNIGTLRSTFHGKSRYDDEMDVRRKGLPIQRISSAGAELSGADSSQLEQHPVRDDAGRHSGRRARSHKSVKSEESDGLALHLTVIDFPEDNSTVFKVLGHEVSKGALPDTISEEVRNAMVKSLENCHSVQEVIRLMVSYGCSPMSEKLQGIQVENERLQKKLDRIKSEHKTLQLSFQEAKEMEETLYARCQQLECNEGYLSRSLYYCQRALEANELLVEMKSLPSEHPGSGRSGYPSHFPTFDTGSISEASSRSPDHSNRRHSLIMKARSLLQSLDTDQHLQELYLCHSQDPASSSLSTTWQPELSQNTTSGVSGISSLSSIDGDLNTEEVERLKIYSRIMKSFSNKMDNVVTLEPFAARPKSHVAPDTYRCESSSPIVELEKATHAEELATIREEKAELRSRIYMMEQNQRRLELELSQKDLQNRALNKAINHLQYQMLEEKRRRKRDKSRAKKEGGMMSYEGHVTDLTSELQEHMEREKELVKQYEDLYSFLSDHVAKAKDNHDQLLEFIKDLKRANNALVEAYEKSKLKQKMERRHMQQEYNRAIVLGQPIDQSSDAGLRQNQARL